MKKEGRKGMGGVSVVGGKSYILYGKEPTWRFCNFLKIDIQDPPKKFTQFFEDG